MINKRWDLNDEQINAIKGMSEYWEEISKRDNPNVVESIANSELGSVMEMTRPVQILKIISDHANNIFPKKALVKQGWKNGGTDVDVVGPLVNFKGEDWYPYTTPDNDTPQWMKAIALKF